MRRQESAKKLNQYLLIFNFVREKKMSVVFARIDDRLIHGQVTEGWGRYLKPDVILVVSDTVASSDWECDLCLGVIPDDIEGEVVDIRQAARRINELIDDDRKAYVLFESPEDAYKAVRDGARLSKLNVGGLHSSRGKREIIDYIFVDDTDSFYLKALKDTGVELEFKDLPQHANVDVMARL